MIQAKLTLKAYEGPILLDIPISEMKPIVKKLEEGKLFYEPLDIRFSDRLDLADEKMLTTFLFGHQEYSYAVLYVCYYDSETLEEVNQHRLIADVTKPHFSSPSSLTFTPGY